MLQVLESLLVTQAGQDGNRSRASGRQPDPDSFDEARGRHVAIVNAGTTLVGSGRKASKYTRAGEGGRRPIDPARVGKVPLESENPWYSRKPYLHFDEPLGEAAALRYVSDPGSVARHCFYPLLSYVLSSPRIKKLSPGGSEPFERSRKDRPIAYPSHKDGYIFSYYKHILEPVYEHWLREQGLGESVTAFRKTGENNVSLAARAIRFIRDNPDCRILATDVEGFYENLDHGELKQVWRRFLPDSSDASAGRLPPDHFAVYKAVTRYCTAERYKVYNRLGLRSSRYLKRGRGSRERLCMPKEFREKIVGKGLVQPHCGLKDGRGIPQGTSLSPLLSNMYMADFDLAVSRLVGSWGGRYWRYCDDILIVVPGDPVPGLLGGIDERLSSLRLKRSGEKTHELSGGELRSGRQLQYLGLVFNGTDVVIRSSSIHRYHRKLKKGLRAAVHRQRLESCASGMDAPLRRQALYNMYSELPVRGEKVRQRQNRLKHSGNFIRYLDRAVSRLGADLGADRIKRQRRKLLRHFRRKLRERL